MQEERIYTMELHETFEVDDNCMVTRVPGGWLYSDLREVDDPGINYFTTSVFVPFNNEFQTKHPWNKQN